MSKPTSDAPSTGLAERVKQIAQALGLHWDGLGNARLEQLENGSRVWRVYDEWGDVGGSALFDALSGDLLCIEETPPEREGPWQPLPDHLVPSDEELFAFTRSKLDAIGWTQLAEMTGERIPGRASWRIQVITSAPPGRSAMLEHPWSESFSTTILAIFRSIISMRRPAPSSDPGSWWS